MTQLTFTEDELMQSVDYAAPQVEAGHRLHGGFDAEGNYLPPRMKYRAPAFEAWIKQLEANGGQLMPADSSLLAGIRFPSVAQQKLLLLVRPGPYLSGEDAHEVRFLTGPAEQ